MLSERGGGQRCWLGVRELPGTLDLPCWVHASRVSLTITYLPQLVAMYSPCCALVDTAKYRV